MPQFSTAWFDDKIEHWTRELAYLKGRPSLRFLEIGCFEGRATHWMLETILTDPSSAIDVVDTFEGSAEHEEASYRDVIRSLRETFEANIERFGAKVHIHQGRSHEELKSFEALGPVFDFIYIDGSHHPDDVYLDAVLCWPLIKNGGIVAFDDYKWTWRDPISGEVQRPKTGIDRFLREHTGEYALLHKSWQLHIRKQPESILKRTLAALRWQWPFSKLPIRKSQIARKLSKLGIRIA